VEPSERRGEGTTDVKGCVGSLIGKEVGKKKSGKAEATKEKILAGRNNN